MTVVLALLLLLMGVLTLSVTLAAIRASQVRQRARGVAAVADAQPAPKPGRSNSRKVPATSPIAHDEVFDLANNRVDPDRRQDYYEYHGGVDVVVDLTGPP